MPYWTPLTRLIPGAVEIGVGEETASVTISVVTTNLPFDHVHLLGRNSVLSTSGDIDVAIRFNADATATYHRQGMNGAVTTRVSEQAAAATSFEIHSASDDALEFSGGEFIVVDAFSTAGFKAIQSYGANVENDVRLDVGHWSKSGNPAIISVTWLALGGGSFDVGSMFSLGVVDENFAIPGTGTIIV